MSYEEDCYSSFAFFMGMFCQADTSSPVFFHNGCTRTESTETFDEVVYELCHDVCGDGNVRSSVSYDCNKYDNLHVPRKDEMVIQNVYRSPNIDINVDLCMDSNGYYPEEGSKKMYSEFAFYDKSLGVSRYEDCGKKHLYEQHHSCKGELMNKYCGVFSASRLSHTNYKQNDMFQVENEETVELLDNFFSECNDTDFRSKVLSFSTLIPPSASRQSHKVHRVIVTEINVDLSCSYVSPCTIQDPVYINFDDDMMQLHLDDPHFSNADDKDFSHVKFQWHHQCLLSSLTGMMKDYGKVESTVSFTTFKYNLLSVCDKATRAYNGAHENFLENFIISIMIHCIRHGMKEINEEVSWLKKKDDKHDDFRLLYSPGIVHLLSALNMFRRSLSKQVQLNDRTLICKKIWFNDWLLVDGKV